MNLNKHIYEGWTVGDFINEIEPIFDTIQANYIGFGSYGFGGSCFKTKKDIINWCKDEQPYYKKNIPEVSNYFIKKAGF